MIKKNGNKESNGKPSQKNKKVEIKEFDFGDSKTARAMVKALTITRKRLYPERYDEKGNLKPKYAKNKAVI